MPTQEEPQKDQPKVAPPGGFRYAQPPAPPTIPAPPTGAGPRYAPPPPDAPQPPRAKPDPEFITESTSEPTLDSVSMLKAVDSPPTSARSAETSSTETPPAAPSPAEASTAEPPPVEPPPAEAPPEAASPAATPPAAEPVGPKPARGGHVASPADPRSAPVVTPAMFHENDESHVPEDTDDATLVQARKPRPSRWTIVGNGQSFSLYTRNLIGRRPSLPRGYDAQLIALANDTKTVSKTHARLEVEGSTLWVTDMGSTNGTFLSFDSDDGPAYQECEPGDDYEVRVGDTITFGDVEMTVVFENPESGEPAQ